MSRKSVSFNQGTTGGSYAAPCSPQVHVASELLCFIRRTLRVLVQMHLKVHGFKSLHPLQRNILFVPLVILSYMFHTLTQYWANYKYADFATEAD